MSVAKKAIRGSLGFLNVCEALDRVFGVGGWRVHTIWPDHNPDDFDMAVDIGEQSKAAYISVFQTYMVRDGFGLGGIISIGVPTGSLYQHRFPDGVRSEGVIELIGTGQEREHYRFGGSGKDIADAETYVAQVFNRKSQLSI